MQKTVTAHMVWRDGQHWVVIEVAGVAVAVLTLDDFTALPPVDALMSEAVRQALLQDRQSRASAGPSAGPLPPRPQ